MPVAKFIQNFLIFGLGILLTVYAEAALGVLCVLGLLVMLQAQSFPQRRLPIVLAFVVGWLPMFFHGRFDWLNLFLGILAVALFWVFQKLIPWYGWLARGVVFGLLAMLVIFALQTFGFLPKESWTADPNFVKQEISGSKNTFTAMVVNAYILYLIDHQGSGEIKFQIDMRTTSPRKINIFLSHPKIRKDVLCLVKTDWTICEISLQMPSRDFTYFGLGGYGTWNVNDPSLEVQNPRVIVITPPTLMERFSSFSRASGFSFNFNAFGAAMAILGVLAVALASGHVWAGIAFSLAILSILLSASRGAMVAFFVALLVLVLMRSRFYKVLPWLFIVVLIGVSTVLVSRSMLVSVAKPKVASEIRFDVTDGDFARDRIETWRLVTKVWLENPRSFLFGTADLTSAMQNKLDARASAYGLTKESLTHAHNLWLQMAGQSGLLALGAMLWLWGWVVLRAWRSRDAGALALLAAIFVINSVDYLFFYAPVHLVFWIAAVGLKRPNETKVLLVQN